MDTVAITDLTALSASTLAAQIEAHLSPALRAQLLEADLAIANALRELVEVERAKRPAAPISGSAKAVRLTLYPETRPKARTDPAYSGSARLCGRSFSLRVWIATNQEFINVELAVL
jgi:hypothetical protein